VSPELSLDKGRLDLPSNALPRGKCSILAHHVQVIRIRGRRSGFSSTYSY
jgi:hypothetical protein